MPFKIVYLERAYTDLETVLDYIAKDSPVRAVEYLGLLQNKISPIQVVSATDDQAAE